MSTFLYRVGKAAFGNPLKVLFAWLGILLVLGVTIAVNPPTLSNEIRIDGTPAQQLVDDLTVALPEAAGGQGSLVFQAAEGADLNDPEQAAALAEAVEGVYGIDEVIDPRAAMAEAAAAQAEGPGPEAQQAQQAPIEGQPVPLVIDGQPVPGVIVTAEGDTALLQFQFTKQVIELEPDTIDNTVEAARTPAAEADIDVLPGSALVGLPEVVGIGEVVGIAVAAIVLFITLGSIVAAGLPLLTAMVGVASGIGAALALSFLFNLNSISVVLALMLGLAVGIDYALFIVNRQRALIFERRLDAKEATGRALGTAGSAVFFAGTTVIIALVALVVANVSLLTTMALIAAGTVAISVLIALTLLPAMLGFVGERIASDKARAAHADHATENHPAATRWSRFLVRFRFPAALAVVALTAVMAIPMTDMRLGLPSGESYSSGTEQRESYDAVSDAFGEGLNGPLIAVARSVDGNPISQEALGALTTELGEYDEAASATMAGANEDGTIVLLSVVPADGPTDATTEDLVHEIRDSSARYADEYGFEIGITGVTAMGIDIADNMADVLPKYLAVVMGLSLIVLLLVFRSIVVPLKATVGFLLSILATFGATTALFQWGWLNGLFGLDSTGPVLALLPVIVTGVLYGLAMDYQVFLVSSMRESYVHGRSGNDAVVHGFTQSSRVVVAAAIIMVSVFAGFIFNGDPMIKQMGFALAVGILIDAFLIRMTLVPAVMSMVGDKAWWLPKWLDKALPDLDVEGDKLLQQLECKETAAPTHV
ncbi:MMPL family transporter [Nocardioides gilvus]|uniref:MMPL family transporter n=1 Tax=Nocardioides gilvus TaxID=1735589 RepID=UPI000D7484C0|nr:MMPL family transporter [Nocardioides gilvus]